MSKKVKIEKTEIGKPEKKKPQFTILRNDKLFLKADTFAKAREGLKQAEQAEETVVNIKYDFKCYPLDGIVAVNQAMEQVFGFSRALDRPGFWGPQPPLRISVKTGVDSEVQVSAGMLNPPSWEAGYINMHVMPDNPMALMIMGQLKRKFEPSINEVVTLAKEIVKTNSIYRKQAVELDLTFIDKMEMGQKFNPDMCAPVFLDVSQPVQLILPKDVEFELQTDIWDVLRRPDDFRYNRMKIKHGVLLSGPFGTGKSLTAAITAKVATESNWTYFSLKTPHRFLEAYNLAQFYGPSVLFVEDVDLIFAGGRTDYMNKILETLDGIGSKNSEVVTIFTTNFPEKINEAFMRSGRVDNHIKFRAFDADAAGRFVEAFSGEFLAPDVNLKEVGYAFDDMVPADISEGVDKAKRRAIGQFGREIKGKITTEMLVNAGEVVRRQRGKGGIRISQEEFNLRIVQAATFIQMGKEIPVTFDMDPDSYFKNKRDMKRAKAEPAPEGAEQITNGD